MIELNKKRSVHFYRNCNIQRASPPIGRLFTNSKCFRGLCDTTLRSV